MRRGVGIAAALVAAVAACTSMTRGRDALAGEPSRATPVSSFTREGIQRGRVLALVGNCNICHTAGSGASYAGGSPIGTPFGTLYASNITPDRDTGIGGWSLDDFRRAMREGVAPGGRQLYPAFPYDHFARVATADIDALYAYLMTREPVSARTPPSELRPPFNFRPLLVFWKVLYFHPRPIIDDPQQSGEWNRGRYLVEGVAHCGACHTPRNAMGAELRDRDLAGGDAEGWHAPALDEGAVAPQPWTVDALVTYLRSGYDERHGASRGPMAEVATNLASVPEADIRAMAVYIASRAARSNTGRALAVTRDEAQALPAPVSRGSRDNDAATLYEGACASCHDRSPRAVQLERSTAVTDVVPTNIVRVITDGLTPHEGERSRSMPGFRGALTAAQTVDLVNYIRARYSRAPPWTNVEAVVAKVLGEGPRKPS